jgi:hypothetical protein
VSRCYVVDPPAQEDWDNSLLNRLNVRISRHRGAAPGGPLGGPPRGGAPPVGPRAPAGPVPGIPGGKRGGAPGGGRGIGGRPLAARRAAGSCRSRAQW